MTLPEFYKVWVQAVYLSAMPDDVEEDEEWVPHELVGPIAVFWLQGPGPEKVRKEAAQIAVSMHPGVLAVQVQIMTPGAGTPHEYRRGPQGVYHDTGSCITCSGMFEVSERQ